MAILPAKAGACAFQVEISPLRDWRVGGRGVERLTDGLEDRLLRQAEEGADTRGGARAEVGDVVDLVLVQADGAHEVDLDLVAGQQALEQLGTVGAGVLGDGEEGRDVVARVRVVGGEEGVVVVELAHGDAVGPGGPLGAVLLVGRQPEDGRAGRVRVRLGLAARADDGGATDARGRDGGVVDDAVDDHVDGPVVERAVLLGGERRELAGELVLCAQGLAALVGADGVDGRHAFFSWVRSVAPRGGRWRWMLVRASCRCSRSPTAHREAETAKAHRG